MTGGKINPEMMILARESRGLTQKELAVKSNIGQALVSKYENGMCDISDENLRIVSGILDYPASLFTQSDSILGFGSTCFYYRKRVSLPIRELKRIQAKINLMRMHIARLLVSAEIEPKYEFPTFDIDEYKNDPELIADFVRKSWRLPSGPIKNLVEVIELSGAIIVPMAFGTRRLDAISLWPNNMYPLIFINIEMLWERIRLSLAHELGHLIMHKTPTDNQESEANDFASAFLMPKHDIANDLQNLTIPKAAQLKPFWRVSMQAIIYRAHKLKHITSSQYQRFFAQISSSGYRISEPNPITPENPSTLKSLIDVHFREHKFTISELSARLNLAVNEFEATYLPRSVGPITIVK